MNSCFGVSKYEVRLTVTSNKTVNFLLSLKKCFDFCMQIGADGNLLSVNTKK